MDDCIFCQIVRGEAESWKILETNHAYAFLCIFPATEWHALVIPKAHHINSFDVPKEAFLDVLALVKDVVDLYRDKLGIENAQIINSSGPEAQQDVFHLHFHVVPRRKGDGQDVNWTEGKLSREELNGMLERLKTT